jgi:hypothetical protein
MANEETLNPDLIVSHPSGAPEEKGGKMIWDENNKLVDPELSKAFAEESEIVLGKRTRNGEPVPERENLPWGSVRIETDPDLKDEDRATPERVQKLPTQTEDPIISPRPVYENDRPYLRPQPPIPNSFRNPVELTKMSEMREAAESVPEPAQKDPAGAEVGDESESVSDAPQTPATGTSETTDAPPPALDRVIDDATKIIEDSKKNKKPSP